MIAYINGEELNFDTEKVIDSSFDLNNLHSGKAITKGTNPKNMPAGASSWAIYIALSIEENRVMFQFCIDANSHIYSRYYRNDQNGWQKWQTIPTKIV